MGSSAQKGGRLQELQTGSKWPDAFMSLLSSHRSCPAVSPQPQCLARSTPAQSPWFRVMLCTALSLSAVTASASCAVSFQDFFFFLTRLFAKAWELETEKCQETVRLEMSRVKQTMILQKESLFKKNKKKVSIFSFSSTETSRCLQNDFSSPWWYEFTYQEGFLMNVSLFFFFPLSFKWCSVTAYMISSAKVFQISALH